VNHEARISVTRCMLRVLPSTGYRYAYPFLDSSGLELDTCDNHAAPLYKHVFPPAAAPSLAFVGLLWKSLRYIQFEMQVPECVITFSCLFLIHCCGWLLAARDGSMLHWPIA